jgi:hypothetical protein
MKTSAFNFLVLLASAVVAHAQDAKVPEGPPPPELVGRWLEKTVSRKGDLVGYTLYCFSRKSDFVVLSRVRNQKTRQWIDPKKFYGKERSSLLGYFEAEPPTLLKLQIVVLAMAILPVEVRYSIQGNTLTLSRDLFEGDKQREVHCVRVSRLPGESAAEAAAFQQRLENGVNGPEFRRVFEHAAHEMSDHPRDQEMISNFIEHREELETLRKMMQEDKDLKRVDFDFTKPSDPGSVGVSAERIAVYRELCKRVGLERGVEAFGDSAKQVTFIASARGLAISGSSKCYVWLRDPPRNEGMKITVNDLDIYARKKRAERRLYFAAHKRAMSGGSFDAFRHIEGNWYLEYQFGDSPGG